MFKLKVTAARSKVKPWHCTPTPPNQCKYKLPTPYGFWDITRTRFLRSRSLQQGQIKVRPWHCTPTPPNQCPYQVSTSHTSRFPRYSPDKILKVKVTMARSKVIPRSNHDVAHIQPLTNVPAKYQLRTDVHLMVSEIQPRQTCFGQPIHPPIQTPWVKTIPQQPLTGVG